MPSQSQSGVSRRRFFRQTGFTAISLALSAYAATAHATSPAIPRPRQGLASLHNTSIPPLTVSTQPQLLPSLPLDAKIGQMLLLGFRGTSIDDNSVIAKNIRDQHIGSVVLFGPNIISPDQLKTLTGRLQRLAQLPLLISVDQEGGQVARLSERRGFRTTVSAARLGADNNTEEDAHSGAAAMAQSLADAGINLNLAPVVDVAVNPTNPIIASLERSFSADPEVVAAQAAAFIDGHHDMGVKCTLKHFPGHGSSQGDTHQGFVNVTDTWSVAELIPYMHLIEQDKVDAIMTAHIFDANLDPDFPATLSRAVITGLLREKLGFDGVVLSDDIQMRAITDRFSLEKAFELAILAGIDVISVANNVTYSGTIADRFINTVHRLLDDGTITEERIDQSFRRVMRLKGLAS